MNEPDAAECRRRADLMTTRVGIIAPRDEDAAIIFKFYSAYHTIKAAFVEDPVFDSVSDLSAMNLNLTLQDRYATSHSGRPVRGGYQPGVNDIVRILYPHVADVYRSLHQASVNVRYNGGLRLVTVAQVDSHWRTVLDAYRAGTLKAA